ncbi:amidase family protein [Cohnella sp. GCM10027633]|uniref:amidase family protein n=1 Tax=unclassified Cohnella TaxID=2636738 RepID=UPI0036353A7F
MTIELDRWIVEADIAGMQRGMEEGSLRSEELTRAYIDRIQACNDKLRAVLEINPEAIAIAKALDAERRERGSRGILHGIPILLKDNIDTHDRMHTSAGSVALANSVAAEDSWVAKRLRAAGAVLLGKTNMTEWAGYMAGGIWAGYSSRGGLTLNPYGPGEMFVGGSSSGSAVAAAANLAAAAIGTETSGSIISPASQNNIVGLKPTIGLIGRSGIIPISHSQDTAGPMARTVADAARLLGALTGVDERDAATKASDGRAYADYTPFLDASYLRHARIGIPRFYYGELDEARLAIIEAAIEALRQAGATIVDPVTLPCERTEWTWDVLRYEFKKGVDDYLAGVGSDVPVRTLSDVIAYNERHGDVALKYGQDGLEKANETSGTLTEQAYADALKQNEEMARRLGLDHALKEHRLDALLFLGNEGGSDLAARAGYPSITVPGGFAATGIVAPGGYVTKGPQGITFVGAAYSEPVLIKLAYGYEQATKHRTPPPLG